MLKVTVRKQRRIIDDHDTDFLCRASETKEIPDRYLKANSIKALFWTGDLIIVEGKHTMSYKGNDITIEAKEEGKPYVARFEENGKKMVKDLVEGDIKEEDGD